ncbi:MAG: hypothetical protein KA314_13295 [Chloroflexi bacterium]|nr:hypothetical protein [Chloroflexota bacterium]MBP8056809.1 hypothetical protein [Chloroflexota bacterium]
MSKNGVIPLAELFNLDKNSLPYSKKISLTWWQQCLALWLLLGTLLTITAFLGANILEAGDGIPANLTVSADKIPGIWGRWDAGHYLAIATSGYAATLPQNTLGFFPLYPLLMQALSRLTGLNLALSGMVIAQVSYLVAILLFYRLARLIHDDHGYAWRSTLFLTLFPTAFFYLALYAESLYLALAILTVYLLLRPRPHYGWSGVACGLASLARPVGWLFNLVFLAEFARRRVWQWRLLLLLGLGLFMSVAGVGLYVVYTYTLTGSWLAIPDCQALWQRQWQLPWLTYGQSVRYLIEGNGLTGDWFLAAINGVDLAVTTVALGLTAAAAYQAYHHRYPWSLVLYLVVSLLFLLAQRGPSVVPCWGMSRWIGSLFPLFLVLGNTTRSHLWQKIVLVLSAGLLLGATAWWTSGRWVG